MLPKRVSLSFYYYSVITAQIQKMLTYSYGYNFYLLFKDLGLTQLEHYWILNISTCRRNQYSENKCREHCMMRTKKIEYYHDETVLEGYLAYNADITKPRPGVLVVHDWTGRNEFASHKADKLAELGYVGFALDMFGKGVIGKDKEEKSALIKPFVDDRKFLLERMQVAYETFKKIDVVDTNRIAAIGFCFGGMCVLDLARSGCDLRGVVSFHGLLHAPNTNRNKIQAKVLALHGYDDPMVPPNVVADFESEMTARKADWQVDIYGNTMHAFTNPVANDPDFGTVYNTVAEKRAWIAMKNFFSEIMM